MTNKLVYYPNKILRTKAIRVQKINEDVNNLVQNMLKVMYANKGIGLAANQVGSNLNLFVVDLQENDVKTPMVLINPLVNSFSKETADYEEGCLSLPGIHGWVTRPKEIELEFTDLQGKQQKITANSLLSVCLQHEMDHLNGKIFLDRMPTLEKSKLLREYALLGDPSDNE